MCEGEGTTRKEQQLRFQSESAESSWPDKPTVMGLGRHVADGSIHEDLTADIIRAAEKMIHMWGRAFEFSQDRSLDCAC